MQQKTNQKILFLKYYYKTINSFFFNLRGDRGEATHFVTFPHISSPSKVRDTSEHSHSRQTYYATFHQINIYCAPYYFGALAVSVKVYISSRSKIRGAK